GDLHHHIGALLGVLHQLDTVHGGYAHQDEVDIEQDGERHQRPGDLRSGGRAGEVRRLVTAALAVHDDGIDHDGQHDDEHHEDHQHELVVNLEDIPGTRRHRFRQIPFG